MKLHFFLFLIAIAKITMAQDTVFMNEKWSVCEKNKATYFRIEKKEGKKWSRTDYYSASKTVQMTGTYLSLNPEVADGYFEWIYPCGKMKHKGAYKAGKETGTHYWYYEDGQTEAVENYKNGELDGSYEEFYPDGKLKLKMEFEKGILNGPAVNYAESGKKEAEGRFSNGNKLGEWKYYDENGSLLNTVIYKLDYEIDEAKLHLTLPNDEWWLADHSGTATVQYIFKRNEITDSVGRAIIPAIMIFIEDASSYNQDVITYSMQKRLAFRNKNLEFESIIPSSDEKCPLKIKNSLVMKARYSEKGFDHIFYMVYFITKSGKGIQLYMDMTKELEREYETEFINTLQRLKETD